MRTRSDRRAPRLAAWLLAAVVGLTSAGCQYNEHVVFGATEKLAMTDDLHMIPKTLGVIVTSPFDAIFAPWFMIWDQAYYDPKYDPEHKYFSFAGSRVVARSDMAWGYAGIATIFALPIDTVYLILTGPVDLIWLLAVNDANDGSDDEDEDEHDDD